MSEMTDEKIDQINAEMAECVLDAIKRILTDIGIPEGTWTEDRVLNLVAMYNLRGDMLDNRTHELNAKTIEAEALKKQCETLGGVLVELANWPNYDGSEEVKAMKTWASAVADPYKVIAFRSLTNNENTV